MKLVKSLLLASVAGLSTVAVAQAADLPSRKAAPVEYVKVCNAYGAGFFYIPGTDTCLKVGGLVYFDARSFTLQRTGAGGNSFVGLNGRQKVARDLYGTTTLGRVELDARTQTAWGTLRTFVRVDGVYSTASTGVAGALQAYGSANGAILPANSKDVTYINKAFIQFAGITAGRAQSMFDFYADAYNTELLRGSNATTNLLAYTATFGGGFSATLSLEDGVARRAYVGSLRQPAAPGVLPQPYAEVAGNRAPDAVLALRVDQAWGSAQLSGALHKVEALEGTQTNTATNPLVYPTTILSNDSKLGYALQGGVKINLPMLAAGDALYLQATYAKGAVGYTVGTNLVYFEGFNNTKHQGGGALNALNSSPHMAALPYDCVFTAPGKCDLSTSFAITGALKHFWTPSVSQAIFAGYYDFKYSKSVVNAGVSNAAFPHFREVRVGTNVFWTPVKGFDIGAEVMYMKGTWNKAQTVAGAVITPLSNTAQQLETRVIIRRAF